MDYEKEYNEALERAKKLKETCDSTAVIGWCEYLFPSLKESEGEKIRKELIDYLKERKSCESYGQYVLRYNRWINWFEKQGASNPYSGVSFEYNGHTWGMCARDNGVEILVDGAIKERVSLDDKPQGKSAFEPINKEEVDNANKVEAKFKIGDWVVNEFHDICLITDIDLENNYYICKSNRFGNTEGDIDLTDKEFHHWNIRDAKDGDILCTYDCGRPKIIFILKGTPINYCVLSYYCYYNFIYPYFEYDSKTGCIAVNNEDVKPATKEQCNALFQEMREAGYNWDKNKKELIKL